MIRTIWTKLHHPAFIFIIFEIDIHFTRSGTQSTWILHQTLHCMRNTLWGIIVVIIHIHNNITIRLFMHNISLLPKCHFIIILEIFHIWMRFHHIFNRVAPIINNNPLHSIFGIILTIKTLYHHIDKWTPIKRRCTYTYKRKIAIAEFIFTFFHSYNENSIYTVYIYCIKYI